MLTPSVEDYLKAVYHLSEESGRATTTALATRLGVSPASVTGMLRKLSGRKPSLVVYRKHRGAQLTDEGNRRALAIVRRHRLLELFLQVVLGYTWDEVHDEAERLEHAISGGFESRIAQALGNPTIDPHGEPIPTADSQLPPRSGRPLSELRPGQRGLIAQVVNASPPVLRHLSNLGLLPATRVAALDFSPLDENLSLQVDGRRDPIVIGAQLARYITVEIE